jgi:hypothetical protein
MNEVRVMIMMWRDEMSDDSKISESRWPTKNDSDGSGAEERQ